MNTPNTTDLSPSTASPNLPARPDIAERTMHPVSGWVALVVGLALAVGGVFAAIRIWVGHDGPGSPSPAGLILAAVVALAGLVVLSGLFVIQPNHAVVLTFFGSYRGTVRTNGLRWVLPIYRRQHLSLRLQNLDGEVLKVNDLGGNPIEVSVVVVWRVGDTARAVFAVENYHHFVAVQSEAAVRDVATSYYYDVDDDHARPTLRGSSDEVLETLHAGLRDRLGRSGVVVEEARINHLAYAPEIAGAMLRRQQARAVVAARASIVDGALDIARSAVGQLRDDDALRFGADHEATLVSNLLVVLCSETDALPTVPLG